MATIILRTNAGAAHDHAVRNGNAVVSPISHIKLLSGTPILDVPSIVGLTALPGATVHSFDRRSSEDCDWAITEEGAYWTRFEAHLVESITGMTITGIAIVLSNGVLWGYAPYLPAQGGLTKTAAFSWTLDLLIIESTDDATPLTLSYEPLDLREMRRRIEEGLYEATYERLRTAFYATICDITAAPLHEDGECLEIPLNESTIINLETGIVAKPIL